MRDRVQPQRSRWRRSGRVPRSYPCLSTQVRPRDTATPTPSVSVEAERDCARAVVAMESKTVSSTSSLRNKIHQAFSDFSVCNTEKHGEGLGTRLVPKLTYVYLATPSKCSCCPELVAASLLSSLLGHISYLEESLLSKLADNLFEWSAERR